jgi:hypothetical protein
MKSLKGQGNLHSQSRHLISSSSSIVSRLVSHSITGRSLDLQVNQHNGYRLHLVWEHKRKGKTSKNCFERCFNNYSVIEGFCEELVNGMLESLCDCVSEGICSVLGEDKTEMCNRENYGFDSQKYLYISRREKSFMHELKQLKCGCPISSSYRLYWRTELISLGMIFPFTDEAFA